MFVGVLRLTFRIPGARSLKDRRRVVRSFKDRVQARLRVAVGEVGGLDEHRRAVLGIAVVARDAQRCDELLAAAAAMAGGLRDAELVDRATEIVPFGVEGSGVRDCGAIAPLEHDEPESRAPESWPPRRCVVDSRSGDGRHPPRVPPAAFDDPDELSSKDGVGEAPVGLRDPSDVLRECGP